MELVLVFDLRAPGFGTPRADLYSAALDIAAWADSIGFDVLGLGEHHCAEDGYNPSPLILGSAFAARTSRIAVRTAVLLASCYDPIRLAEDTAVLQILSGNRFELGLGFGYRRCEFEMFGRRVEDRFAHTCKVAETLRLAWTGQQFEYEGRPCHVQPVPAKPVPILFGGQAPSVARAAARLVDGFLLPMQDARTWQPYRDECMALGKPDPGAYPRQGPTFLWVSEDPERDWEWLTPHIVHVLESYARWTAAAYGRPTGVYAKGVTAETIRRSGTYRVLTPEQTVELIGSLGDNSSLYLTPLLGGIAPARAWKMLDLWEKQVHRHVPRGIVPKWRHTH